MTMVGDRDDPGVSIVLTSTLLTFTKEAATVGGVKAAFSSFLSIFFGSVVVGIVFGLISALVFKRMVIHKHGDVFLEVALSFTFPWASFYLSEIEGLSGIVAILFCGERDSPRPTCNVQSGAAFKPRHGAPRLRYGDGHVHPEQPL